MILVLCSRVFQSTAVLENKELLVAIIVRKDNDKGICTRISRAPITVISRDATEIF
jgi:hypothetical protein